MANAIPMMTTTSPNHNDKNLEGKPVNDEPDYEIAAEQVYEPMTDIGYVNPGSNETTGQRTTRNVTDNPRGIITTASSTSPVAEQPPYLELLNDNDPRLPQTRRGEPPQNSENLYQPLNIRKDPTYTSPATNKPKESSGCKSNREYCLMLVILVIALLALFLVILDIAGVVGRNNCSCPAKGG